MSSTPKQQKPVTRRDTKLDNNSNTNKPSPGPNPKRKTEKDVAGEKRTTTTSTENQYICSICKNTESVRSLNLDLEVRQFLTKISDIKSTTEALSSTTDTIDNIDNHLKHILLHKPSDSFRECSAERSSIESHLKSLSNTLNDHVTNTNVQNDHITVVENNCNNISADIKNILNEIQNYSSKSPQCETTLNNDFGNELVNICDKLLSEQKSQMDMFADKLNDFERKLSTNTSAPSNLMSPPPPPQSYSTNPQAHSPQVGSNTLKGIKNPTDHVESYDPKFIDQPTTDELYEYLNCSNSKFIQLKGRSVLTLGERYPYVGAPKENPEPIPGIINSIIAKIEDKFPNSGINSCLINKYVGHSSSLPEHSDDEPIIRPESNIFTVSVGKTRKVLFRDRCSKNELDISVEGGSLYTMSRSSQNLWSHRIDKDVVTNEHDETEIRYSLTFRSLGQNWKGSTIILGDSNTKYLNFDDDGGNSSFGSKMPGRKVTTYHINDINPTLCLGYQNIVIHVGINDIRDRSPGRKDDDPAPTDINAHFLRLKHNIELIKLMCPKSSLIISLVLPTKLHILNDRAGIFNRFICNYVYNVNPTIRVITHKDFVLNGALNPVYGCYFNKQDKLHLGKCGIRMLAKAFKDNVLPYRRHIDGREYSGVTSGSGKNAGAMDGPSTSA